MVKTVPGGVGPPHYITKDKPLKTQDPDLYRILQRLNPTLLDRYGQAKGRRVDKDSVELKPILYKKQVVAGIMYYVKFEVVHKKKRTHNTEEETTEEAATLKKEYAHARIFYQSWTNTVELKTFVVNKTLNDDTW
ncbi:hypothetical protein BGZ94_006129 [Podila epigama]|nr:hypothetical protein BGZ94_006129 [Podila epigama]